MGDGIPHPGRTTMVRGKGLELEENRRRIATGGHSDDQNRSGILSGSESDLGREKDCSLKNKSVERRCPASRPAGK